MSYRSTVARQTQSLADSLAAARAELETMDLSGFGKGLTAVTGIGASFAAAVVVASELQRRGRRATAIRAVDMAEGRDLADAIIALSHRGRSVETVDALRMLPGAESLSITNNAESPLAKASDHHVTLANGADATPSSTGYTATLLVAGLALDAINGGKGTDWDALPEQTAAILKAADAKMERLGRLFAERRAIDCVGAGGRGLAAHPRGLAHPGGGLRYAALSARPDGIDGRDDGRRDLRQRPRGGTRASA